MSNYTPEPPAANTKQCTRCLIPKPIDEFGVYRRNRDGRHSLCRVCARADRNKYPNTQNNAERKRQRREEWTPEQIEKERERIRNRDRRLKQDPKYRERLRERTNASARKRMARAFERLSAYKLEVGCVDCGYRQHAAALEFDHLPGVIRCGTVSYLAGNEPWRVALAEIAKCEVVCSNCHSIRTFNRKKGTEPAISDGE